MRLTLSCVVLCMVAHSPAQEKQKYPDLGQFSPSNWGTVTFAPESGQFTFDGHPQWFAVGHVRKDGRIFILWTLRATDEPCPGVYDMVDGNWTGKWGHSSSCQIDGDGNLVGTVMSDSIYKVEPPKGDIQ